MREIEPGHAYQLDSYDGHEDVELIFMKRRGSNYPGNETEHAGTNCQEVIRVLIERCRYLQKQLPCAETQAAIMLLQTTLLLFEQRAKRVKNEQLRVPFVNNIEDYPTCKVCGHILCHENHSNS